MSSIFGPLVGGDAIEAAVVATMKRWLPTYLAELERRTDRAPGSLPSPASWATVNEFSQTGTDPPPWGIVVSPGTVGEPERLGDGSFNVWWGISVAIIVTAESRQAANDLAKLYAVAVRAIMLQRPSLGDVAAGVEWVAEANAAAPTDYLRVGWVTESQFNVRAVGVVNAYGGPAEPDLDPADLPQVASAHIATERIVV